jgi:hypothetical protein
MTGRDTTKLQPILTDVSIRYDHKRTEFHFARIGNRSEGESRNANIHIPRIQKKYNRQLA